MAKLVGILKTITQLDFQSGFQNISLLKQHFLRTSLAQRTGLQQGTLDVAISLFT